MLLENNPYPADVRVRQEAESLARAGHTVTVVAPRGPGQSARETVAGVAVRRFRAPAEGTGAVAFLREYLVAGLALHVAAVRELVRGADVLHLHNPPDFLFAAGLLARLLRRRVVFDHHDLFPELVAVRFGPGPLVHVAAAGERATFAVSNVVLAANESHAEIARGRGRMPATAVTVVRNGPAPGWLDLEPRQRDGALTDPRLVFLGSVAEQDGVEALAEVVALLGERHGLTGARLTIVGDGDARGAVEAAAAAHGIADRVELTGWIDPADVPERVLAGDICVDPAVPNGLNEHSTMIKIAEFMALAKPVVAYDLLETRRTLGDAGILVAPADPARFAAAVADLAGNPDRRLELGRLARERARGLIWSNSEQNLLDAYERL
jgi:glycosyltransferase involved in cell wall biosynthesis